MDHEKLVLISMGHAAFQIFHAGLELELFDLLHAVGTASLEEVAERLQIGPLQARGILDGLACLGLLNIEGQRFKNSEFVGEIAGQGRLEFLRRYARFQAQIVYVGEMDFVESIKRGCNVGLGRFPGLGDDLYARLAGAPRLRRVFYEFMGAWSRECLPMLLESFDFSRVSHLADVGGGDGTIAIGLAERFENLSITVYETEENSDLARARANEAGVSSRVSVAVEDFFERTQTEAFDGVLLAHFLCIWSEERNLALLRHVYEALRPGGWVVIFGSMSGAMSARPLFAALDSAYFLSIPAADGFIYSHAEYSRWLLESGFVATKEVTCKSWISSHGLVAARKPEV